MGHILGLIQKALIVPCLFSVGACSSTGGQIANAILKTRDAEEPPAFSIDVEKIKATGLAAMAVDVPSSGINGVVFATQARDGRVTYSTSDNRSITLVGGLIFATRSFGTNLQSVVSLSDDPVARMRPFRSWPRETKRAYRSAGTGPGFERVEASCRAVSNGVETFDLFGSKRMLEVITEDCRASDGTRFANVYNIDPSTGFIWSSETWAGVQQGRVKLTVVEPLD